MLPRVPPGRTIRRTLSGTPLARRYRALLEGAPPKRRGIPWQAFERGAYPEAALALAADAAVRLAEGEYHAVGLFSRITSGVAMAGAPFDLISATTHVAADELRHADYCIRFATCCAGEEPVLSIDPVALAAAAPLLPGPLEADFLMAKYVATGETLAAALLLACRKRAKDPVARALFGSILGDEIQHSRLGWYYLAWKAPRWTRAERQAVADPLGEFLLTIEESLWLGRDAPVAARKAADALGVLDSDSQRAVVREVMDEEIVPGLDALGLGASHAWAKRRRGGVRAPVRCAAEARELVFAGSVAGADPGAVVDRAAAWLAGRVRLDGGVAFSMNARTRETRSVGPMHHGRAAIALTALASHGAHAVVAARIRVRLEADVTRALSGEPVPGWPDDPTLEAGTLALVALAGIDVRTPLERHARDRALERSPWYAAQVVAALGPTAPGSLWTACVRGLDADPSAPWTAIAARRRGDVSVLGRCEAALVATIGSDGAVHGSRGPEIPRTAATVEALASPTTPSAREAVRRAITFLCSCPLVETAEAESPVSIDGAFPLVPGGDELRTDATAHVVLALLGVHRSVGSG